MLTWDKKECEHWKWKYIAIFQWRKYFCWPVTLQTDILISYFITKRVDTLNRKFQLCIWRMFHILVDQLLTHTIKMKGQCSLNLMKTSNVRRDSHCRSVQYGVQNTVSQLLKGTTQARRASLVQWNVCANDTSHLTFAGVRSLYISLSHLLDNWQYSMVQYELNRYIQNNIYQSGLTHMHTDWGLWWAHLRSNLSFLLPLG